MQLLKNDVFDDFARCFLYDGQVLHLWWKSTHAELPTNPIATIKFQGVTLGREEAIANSWPDEQKSNIKAYQADKLTKGSEDPKGNRNLDA